MHCRLRKEVKETVMEKKLSVWNEVVEKVNADFEGSRKEFWAFVGRRTKGKYKYIASLKSKAGVSVTSTQGKQKCACNGGNEAVALDITLHSQEARGIAEVL